MAVPAISVLMPVYNAADTLDNAIASIQHQTRTDWELLCVDDGSTDASLQRVAARAHQDSRIRLIQRPHEGIVAALQTAARAARAPFLARMDADDWAYPGRLEKQARLTESRPDIALCGCRVRITGNTVGSGRRRYETWINGLVTDESIRREIFIECPVAHPTFFMRRDAFEAIGGYRDGPWPEDYDLCMRVYLLGYRFAKVDEVLLDWRETPGRLSMNDPRYTPKAFRQLKRHYLHKALFASNRPLYQWGAGEVGKRWLREWEGGRPEAVVDINPRKIGRTIHGTPVIAPDALPPPGCALILVAVGAPGARDEIRAWLEPRGYRESHDFLFLA